MTRVVRWEFIDRTGDGLPHEILSLRVAVDVVQGAINCGTDPAKLRLVGYESDGEPFYELAGNELLAFLRNNA